jgi:hypothetical protein
MARRRHPEDDMQAALVQHINARKFPDVVFWHTPNSSRMGGKRTNDGVPLEAIRLKRLGFRKGVADLSFVHRGNFYAIELKAGDNARPTVEQMQFISDVNAAGGHGVICHDLDRAIRCLECWGLIRGTSYLSSDQSSVDRTAGVTERNAQPVGA